MESGGLIQLLILFWRVDLLIAQQLNNQEYESSSSSTYFYYQQPSYPRDCKEAQDQCTSSNSSGLYLIRPDSYFEPFEVYCENGQDSEGWTVIQRRLDEDLSFARNWTDYKYGFGYLTKEFWIGNEKLSYLTHQKDYELRIDLTISDGSSFVVSYDMFRIADEFSDYYIKELGEYYGTADMFITWCQTNKAYGNCTCQRTCEDPYSCLNICSDADACVCPDEYFLKKGRCVPREECGCYVSAEIILHEGEAYVNSDCTREGVCTNGQLSWDDSYACSNNAVCEERDGERQCYCNPGYRGDGVECVSPTDCLDVYNAGFSDSGVYNITPSNWPGSQFEVYCNMDDGGGWTVFQRRVNGEVDFFRNWNSYKNGFGSPDHEMWLGNEKLYFLTNQKRYKIRIDVVNRNSNPYHALFDNFRINNEADNYRMSQLGTYSGTVDERSNPDGYLLRYHLNHAFTTYDSDNDAHSTLQCAQYHHGAWWYRYCANSNLNGDYHADEDSYESIWINYIPGPNYNIKFTEMKLRPF